MKAALITHEEGGHASHTFISVLDANAMAMYALAFRPYQYRSESLILKFKLAGAMSVSPPRQNGMSGYEELLPSLLMGDARGAQVLSHT